MELLLHWPAMTIVVGMRGFQCSVRVSVDTEGVKVLMAAEAVARLY